ncbi:hypothetical protein N7494_008084 [Penicillium frequentans]|uniref:Serine hydrolase domain-containing protein n=1 Tax=Penicillium frequentans TaxID=3151616 RepID=A0AAD6CUA9_9EURO|nr:hypothetical protein N7494_008084 [Penicillium glabrum]
MLTKSADLELAPYFPDEDEGYAYFNPSDPKSLTTTLDNLEAFILSEGPFDAILAFSHGAQLAATYLVERGKSRSSPGAGGIQFAIFFSGEFHIRPPLALEFWPQWRR